MQIAQFYINMGEIMTYHKLEERSRVVATYLQNGLGLQKGDLNHRGNLGD